MNERARTSAANVCICLDIATREKYNKIFFFSFFGSCSQFDLVPLEYNQPEIYGSMLQFCRKNIVVWPQKAFMCVVSVVQLT